VKRALVWSTLVAALCSGTACGGNNGSNSSSSGGEGNAPNIVTLRVLAASSLTEAFTDIGKAFEAANRNVRVSFDFGASSTLAQQLADGAPADVFVSADEATMRKATTAVTIAERPYVIARNRLALLVANGNPKHIGGLADLARPGVVFVACAPQVPCGKLATAALTKANVSATPASQEENVKAVVAKVVLGEADAGIVYATDVKAAAGKAQGVDLDVADDPALQAVYPLAILTPPSHGDQRRADAARAWKDFLLSSEGKARLRRFGFLAP
jgi:molybdate transport system substrate-binding protein